MMRPEEKMDFFRELTIPQFELTLSENKFVTFQRTTEQKKDVINVMDSSKNEAQMFSCFVQFTRYEALSRESKNLNDTEFSPPSVRPYTQRRLINYEFGKNTAAHFPLKIEEKVNLGFLGELLVQYYYQDAKVFFDYWRDIRMFIPFIEHDTRESSGLLGNNYIIKKMVIWKLCSHPNYESYVAEKVEAIQNALKNDPENENYLHVLKEIKLKQELIKDIEPDFEWNPRYRTQKPFKISPT